MNYPITEALASLILGTAISEGRAAELLDTLFEGGSVTVDSTGKLIFISGVQMEGLK